MLDVLHLDWYPLLALASTSGAPHSTATATSTPPTPSHEGWVRINDMVVDVCPEGVFGAGGIGKDDMRCAYLLFYRRV